MCARDGFTRSTYEEPRPLGLAPQPADLPTAEHSGRFNGMQQTRQHSHVEIWQLFKNEFSALRKVSAGQMFAHVTHPFFTLIERGFEYSRGSENTQAYTDW